MKNRIYLFFAIFSFLLLSFVLVCHFHIKWLPLLCLLLGGLTRIIFKSGYLEIFSFLIPVLPAFAALENKGFPLNYLLLPLFFLCGLMAGEFMAGKSKTLRTLPELPRFYFTFLLLTGTSFFFVMLRWSNLNLSLLALFKDTPIAPTGQRISFGIIFPVVELALFSLSPIYYLLLKRQLDLRRILIAFLSGQSLSIIYSFFQRLQINDSPEIVICGLASDATAFGFLSALAVLLSWNLYASYNCKKSGMLFLLISLLGILNSLTRVGLFAVILVLFLFVFLAKKKVLSLFVVCALLLLSLLLYKQFLNGSGSNFLIRLETNYKVINKSLEQGKIDLKSILKLASGRDTLFHYSWECLRTSPLTGVGSGNFVFWVISVHKGKFFHHLPANQYFFITSSTGLIGLLTFLLFCSGLFRFKKWPEKLLLGTFLFLLIFNDYLWFSEIFLVFWLFISLGENSEEKPLVLSKQAKAFYTCVCGILLFIVFNFLNFSKLHPKNWARETKTLYDYGFSYLEKEGGRQFRWSGEKAGIYLFLDKDNPESTYKLACGAPLSHLPGNKQVVDVYWRGKLFKQVVFRQNTEIPLLIEDEAHGEGFLEFRVHPSFNLYKMGLGTESRDLGVQVSGPRI